MTTAIIPGEVQDELATERSLADEFVVAITQHPCETQSDVDFLSKLLLDVKARHKEWEEKRTRITQPLLQAKRAADELFSPVLSPLKTAEGILKGKIATFTMAREEERRAAMTAGEMPLAPVEQSKGVTVREQWDWEVADIGAVPREYFCLDELKLDEVAKAALHNRTEPPPIPGIHFYKRGQVIARVK